jgi:hypothetical protein
MVAGSDVLYGPPYGRTVTVPSADALMASEVQAPEACDALALSGGLLGARCLLPSTAEVPVRPPQAVLAAPCAPAR